MACKRRLRPSPHRDLLPILPPCPAHARSLDSRGAPNRDRRCPLGYGVSRCQGEALKRCYYRCPAHIKAFAAEGSEANPAGVLELLYLRERRLAD
jgi:hypothetical protein